MGTSASGTVNRKIIKFIRIKLIQIHLLRYLRKKIKSYLAVFRMRDGVDQRVVGAGSLSQDNWDSGDQWSNLGNITPGTNNADDGKRGPCGQPHRHVHDGDLGNADLSRDLLLIVVAAERSNVHLLGLSAELLLVLEDGVDDEVVAAGDDGDGENIVGDGSSHDVGLVVHVLGNVIVGATIK
jgi:hypothetical protein